MRARTFFFSRIPFPATVTTRSRRGTPKATALKTAAVDYRLYIYKGAKHAFNNDTRAERYHKEAAHLAWKRTIAFLKEKLRE